MFKLIYSDFVLEDMKDIKYFISQDNPVNAIKTINSIINTIEFLIEFPYLGKQLDVNELREIVETNYKYKIVYRIEDNLIIILSIYKYQNTWN